MRKWAQEHGKAVRQQNGEAVRHKAFCGNTSLKHEPKGINCWRQTAPWIQWPTVRVWSQLRLRRTGLIGRPRPEASPDLDSNAINFLSRSMRTRSGKLISAHCQAGMLYCYYKILRTKCIPISGHLSHTFSTLALKFMLEMVCTQRKMIPKWVISLIAETSTTKYDAICMVYFNEDFCLTSKFRPEWHGPHLPVPKFLRDFKW